MKSKSISILVAMLVMTVASLLIGVRTANAQRQVLFMCNGVAQGSPNCAPPTPVLVDKIRVTRSFGALAYDDGKAVWYGSFQYPSKSAARKGAIDHCLENGGSACRLMLSYTNQCAAVARVSQNGVEVKGKDTVNTGSTEAEANENARRSCETDWGASVCKVTLSNCSHHNVAQWSEWRYE